jgi:A/G-specific adenine glycosylase
MLTADFARAVVDWQRVHGRHDLPWQQTRDPYRVWISEIMLQQTQVSTVHAYYARFLDRFPTVVSLAAAPQDDVMAAWSGLGYYRRAKFAHRCAQVVAGLHGGVFPRTRLQLETLPGIGRSTAAAIASLCFEERAAILDGNVKRVLTRVLAFEGDVTQASSLKRLWTQADALLPASGQDMPAYTQGVMDLGATLCTARQPQCGSCPVAALCAAKASAQQHDFPVARRQRKRTRRESVWLWLEQGGRLWLHKRPDTGVWASLWSLPEFVDFDALARATQGWPGQGEAMPDIEHALTHFDWVLKPRRWVLPPEAAVDVQRLGDTGRWFALNDALQAGLPTPWRRLLQAHRDRA